MTPDATWITRFPELQRLPEEFSARLLASSQLVSLKEGGRAYAPGTTPESYLLLLDGSVRVQQVSEGGREIVLYRVMAGESCVLTTACLMGNEAYPAEALAETAVKAVAIPRATFDDLIARSPQFRKFVFGAFSMRLTEMFHVVAEVAFARMDIRLAGKLLELSHGESRVDLTQQQLAAELGSAREVVSRMLAEFHRRGLVSTHRGSISITNREALERLVRERSTQA